MRVSETHYEIYAENREHFLFPSPRIKFAEPSLHPTLGGKVRLRFVTPAEMKWDIIGKSISLESDVQTTLDGIESKILHIFLE